MPDMDHPTSKHLGGDPPTDASLLRRPTDGPRLPRGSRALHEAAAVSWTADGTRLSMDETLSASLSCWSPSKPPLPSWLRTRVLKEQSSKPTPTLASRLQGAPAGRDSTTRPFAQQETPSGYTSPRMLYAPTASVSDVHTRCSATTLEPKAAAVSVAVLQPAGADMAASPPRTSPRCERSIIPVAAAVLQPAGAETAACRLRTSPRSQRSSLHCR